MNKQINRGTARWKILFFQTGAAGLFLILATAFNVLGDAGERLVPGLFLISMLAGGWDTAVETLKDLKKKRIEIHFLMLAVAVGASIIGAWGEGALLLFLFSLGGALENFAYYRMNRAISVLTKSSPKTAHIIQEDGSLIEKDVETVQPDMKLLIRPDEVFPVDAIVLEGETEVDESSLTGESLPITKEKGDELFSGTLNLWGKVTVQVQRPVSESALAKIIQMINDAQQSKAPSQRFTDRFGSRYAIGILSFACVMFFVWLQFFDLKPAQAAYRSMSFLVVASPCALVLSIPSAILAGIAWGAKHGVLFRGGRAIEELAMIDTVAFDKTGTLTAGQMEVMMAQSYQRSGEDKLLQIACSIEAGSNHPIALAIAKHGMERGLDVLPVQGLHSLTGMGIEAVVDGKKYILGKRETVAGDSRLNRFPQEQDSIGQTEVWLSGEGHFGRIVLHDEIRKESKLVLSALHQQEITTAMLTGDTLASAQVVADELGLTEVHAGLHPDDKVDWIQRRIHEGKRVAMVGDGVNDAPSLAAAHVSVSIGGRGSDAALEQADIVLVKDRIDRLPAAVSLSQRARVVIRQNLTISLGTVMVMVGATLFTSIPLGVAVLIHESSTVIVCLNSLRLLWDQK